MANYCELFRFDDRYSDVFTEAPGRYLYVCAEPFGWPYLLECNEWHEVKGLNGDMEWIRYDAAGADTAYLETLDHAPEGIAAEIIRREYARTLYASTRGESCYWHGYDEPPTMGECIETAEYCAGIIY